jgi:hypothetical protein
VDRGWLGGGWLCIAFPVGLLPEAEHQRVRSQLPTPTLLLFPHLTQPTPACLQVCAALRRVCPAGHVRQGGAAAVPGGACRHLACEPARPVLSCLSCPACPAGLACHR